VDDAVRINQAWRELLDAVAVAGATVGEAETEIDAAEGFHYVLDVLGDQLDRAAMSGSAHPVPLENPSGLVRTPE
jgi:hypothetical protein